MSHISSTLRAPSGRCGCGVGIESPGRSISPPAVAGSSFCEFREENPEDAAATGAGGRMSKMIPVEESFAEWRKDPNYVEAYDAALEDEFSLAAALIEA